MVNRHERSPQVKIVREPHQLVLANLRLALMNHQRAVVRAFTSWISSGNKALRILTKSNKNPEADVDLLDLSMVSLVMILRSESKQCVDLSIASL